MKSIFKAFYFFVVFFVLSIQVYSQTQGTKPNIIVILADDLGYADVSFNRDPSFPADRGIINTPHLDALAATGIIMKNAHVVHPFCGPSRVALLTGIYPHRIGAQYNLQNNITSTLGVPQSEVYFSKVLQDEGYNTSAIGKWHLGYESGKYQPLDRGFDHFFGFLGGGKNYFESIYEDSFYNRLGGANPVTNEYQDPLQRNRDYVAQNEYSNAANEDYLTDVLTDNAIQYIADKKGDANPFFMYLAYNAPHTPLQATDAEIAAFRAANPNFENNLRNSSYLINSDPVTNLATQAEKDAKIEEFVEARLIYATMTVNMDNNIGRVVTELKKNINDFNNTVIIFLSDNGGYRWSKGADNFPLQQQKGSVLEGGHKVPMFVSWPNQISTPSTYNYQVSSLDIYPTLVNLAGGTIPSGKKIDGLDFMDKIIAGQRVRADNKPLYAIRPQDGFHNGGMVSYPWKIVKTGNNGNWKLYNILNDPGESTDVRSSEANAEQIISDLLDEAETLFYDFKDVKPAWFDNDGNGAGHPHSAEWNDGTLPNYTRLFERSFVRNDNFPLSDQNNSGNWTLNTEISDEFDAVSLDEDKWLIQGKNGEYQSNFIGRSPAQFSTGNAILENGKLKILTKWEPSYNFTNDANGNLLGVYEGVSKPITTAAVISKKQFQYGYMEIKSKAANAEVTSSFWTTGPGGGQPGASELDMFEQFGGHKSNDAWKKRLKFNIISWDNNNAIKQAATAAGQSVGTTHTRNIQADDNTADDFHVYGFEWTADYIKVYIDGVLHPDGTILKSVITNNGAEPDRWVTDVPYWVWLDSETFPWLGLPDAADLTTPAEYQIEYIRVWEKQIPSVAKPTKLTPGDAAIIGYKAAGGNVGEVAYVVFKDINIGTIISFSNRGWKNDGSFREGGSGPYGIDDVFSWTATDTHTAGTIFKLGSNGKVTTVIAGVETEVGTTVQTFGSDGDWDLSPDGDTVLMYNGNSDTHPSDNSSLWVTGLNFDGKSNAAGWGVGGGNAVSDLPTVLVGYNIDVTGGDFNLNLYDINHGVYTGGVTGNPVTMRSSIHNYTNWTLNESTAYNLWDNDVSVSANNGNIILGEFTLLASTTNGVWENSVTWGGTMPSRGDTKRISSDITINSNIISDGGITLTGGSLTVKTGSSLTLNANLVTNNGLILEAGAQIIVTGNSTGSLQYRRTLTATDNGADANKEGWFSVSPPVSGEALNTAWADANLLASGTGGNRGLATYTESNNSWAYFNGTATTFTAGKGYIVKRTENGTVTFEGTVNTNNAGVNVPVTNNEDGFNLLGNPYTANISSVTFIADNTSDLANQLIWVWTDNGNTYNTYNNSSNFDLAPGQAFFVRANKSTTLNFAESNQKTGADSFQKSSKSKIKLTVLNGKTHRYAEVYYLDNATKGFDRGYDGEVFGGIADSFSLYTHLLENNQGKNYQIQALPNSDIETMVVPVGLKLGKDAEITFKLEADNIPAGLKVFLEDRQEGVFTQLDVVDAAYKVSLNKSSDEVGRFYLHTSAKSALSTDNINLQGVSIYQSNKSTLKVTGLKTGKSTISIVNILGKQITNSSFNTTNGNKEIQLPNMASGVYFVQLTNNEGKLIKKIIL